MKDAKGPSYQRLEWGLHLGTWLLFFGVHALLFTQFLRLDLSLLRSLANVGPMAAIFYLNTWLVNTYVETKRYLTFGILVSLVFWFATWTRAMVNGIFPDIRDNFILLNDRTNWFLAAFLTNFIVLILGFFYQLLHNRYRNEKRTLALLNEQREARMLALRAQINPHFLFNTLNNIYSLSVVKSDRTPDMVLKLSELLRYVIYDSQQDHIALTREVDKIRQFIELFQMRSETPRRITFQEKGVLPGQCIEPMMLIPLVENCFKHCDFDTNPHAYTLLDLKVVEDTLCFQTVNTKNNNDPHKDGIGGVGLANIRNRLELQHPEAFTLLVEEQDFLFSVHLKIPIQYEKHPHLVG